MFDALYPAMKYNFTKQFLLMLFSSKRWWNHSRLFHKCARFWTEICVTSIDGMNATLLQFEIILCRQQDTLEATAVSQTGYQTLIQTCCWSWHLFYPPGDRNIQQGSLRLAAVLMITVCNHLINYCLIHTDLLLDVVPFLSTRWS